MPRYFFHIVDNDTRTPDEEGMMLPDLLSVAREALASARDLAKNDQQKKHAHDHRRIEVEDENGTVVMVQLVRSLVQ